MLVNVVVEVNNHKLDQPFSYMVDFAMQSNIKVGQKVVVPFRNRDVEGFVLSISSEYDQSVSYKYVKECSDICLNEEQLMIIKHLRNHNAATMIECINTILPPAMRASIKNKEKKKFVKCLRIVDNKYSANDKEQGVIDYIRQEKHSTLKNTSELYGTYTVNKLRKLGVIEVYEIEDYRLSVLVNSLNYYETLNEEQARVVSQIKKSEKLFHLIHGKTGSGKTVCYIELIKNTLSEGKEVLFLVPEVSLTSQVINIISSHFDEEIAVFHSKIPSSERYDQFRKILDKKVKIAVGTRSSIFLPFSNLGLIVIDESHDESYNQESNVSYTTKEIVSLRSKYHNAKVVLGSATPDVSTYYNCKNSKIVLHELSYNYSKSNVVNNVVDMKSNFDWIISSVLEKEIAKTIENNFQFILLLNRRGYANYIICNECGEVLKCKNCDVTLNLHNNNLLKCHHCNYKTYDKLCECGCSNFSEYGYGLQKVEEVINEKFENILVTRVDTDVLDKLTKASKIFNDFSSQKYHGLIGTQILSKGLNFTNVNLVAIIDADYMLNINSYKASERTFQYIKQSLGRNARGSSKDCLNIIQTYDTDHYSVVNAINDNYSEFYNNEILFRKNQNYPPFTKYTKIMASGSNLSLLVKYMNIIYTECSKLNLNVTKPHFCNIERINMQYRIQILVKHSHFSKIFGIINKIREYNKEPEINFIINCNPTDF